MRRDSIISLLFAFIMFVVGRPGSGTWADPNSQRQWMDRKVLIEKYHPPRGANIDGRGRVDFRDLAIFANNWLEERR